MHIWSIPITSEALLNASKTVLDNRNLKAKEKKDRAEKLHDIKVKAVESYDLQLSGAIVTVSIYANILKYVLIATKSDDTMSLFKNKVEMENRLKPTDNWMDLITKLNTEMEETFRPNKNTAENTDIDKTVWR